MKVPRHTHSRHEAPTGSIPSVRIWLPVASAVLIFCTAVFARKLFGWPSQVSIALHGLVYAITGLTPARAMILELRRGKMGPDFLMLAGACGAAVLGLWSEGALLLILFALGHAGEEAALARATNAVASLGKLMPRVAHRKIDSGLEDVSVETLLVGEVVVVRPGERIPADGKILAGTSDVDQSVVTGESAAVAKETGDEVFAGTVNLSGAIDITVGRIAADNTVARIMRLVTDGQGEKSQPQRLADQVIQRVVPGVVLFALLVAFVPILFFGEEWRPSVHRAILMLLAASPCALVIGTPATVLAGIAQAARRGILIKGGAHLEALARLEILAMDKTGTLTTGQFGVIALRPFSRFTKDHLLGVAAAVEQRSNHPLAAAIVKYAATKGVKWPVVTEVEDLPGRGVSAILDGERVVVGTLRAFQDIPDAPDLGTANAAVEEFETKGLTVVLVRKAERFVGIIGLADERRSSAEAAVERLRALGIRRIVMLTGDNHAVAQRVASAVGITEVRSALMPKDKMEIVRTLARSGPVAMVGDGVNDAPALAAASVGIAMGGGGTAVALDAADVVLTGGDLQKLAFAIELGRASETIIRQNLLIAFGVMAALIVASFANWLGMAVTVAFHESSTVIVVLNALRLLRFESKNLELRMRPSLPNSP